MSQPDILPGAVPFVEMRHWTALRGVKLTSRGQRGYTLKWLDSDGNKKTASVPDLASVPPFLTDLIDRREAAVPGEWYLHWRVVESTESWSPYRRWIEPIVQEGILRQNGTNAFAPASFDPTPYPSPEAALVQAPLLPLDTGAVTQLSGLIFPLYGDHYWIRCPDVSDEMIDEYTLRCLRYHATVDGVGTPGWLDISDNGKWIADRLYQGTGMCSHDAIDSIDRLIVQGTAVQYDHAALHCSAGEKGEKGILIENPVPKRWWTHWLHRENIETFAVESLTIILFEHPEGEYPRTEPNENPVPNGYEGPFDTEEQARENVAGYSLRHGIPVGEVHTAGMRRPDGWWLYSSTCVFSASITSA